MVDSVTGKTLEFASVKQFQNASGNGVDILARLAKDAEPAPPPNAGDFFAFEVKSTLGALDNPPGLSAAQKNPINVFSSPACMIRLGRSHRVSVNSLMAKSAAIILRV